MKLINKPDATQVWQICFPATLAAAVARGAYVVPQPSQLLQVLERGDFPYENEHAAAWLRLELACAYLWPYVEDLFAIDLFPHLLAAATDILRATEYCESDAPVLRLLTVELAESMSMLEKALSADAGQPALAAEPEK